MPFRTRDKADTSDDALPVLLGVRVQIDVGRFGRDTSDTHRDLCRNDKMNDCCCILDTECDMISSENLSFLLGVNAFYGETIIPKGTRGSQLSFKFTIRLII